MFRSVVFVSLFACALTATAQIELGFRVYPTTALQHETAVIQFAVYPGNWAEHLLWAGLLAYILTRGPGPISIDHLIARRA